MPIPPRPIPNSNRARPGSAVPRKSLASLDKLEWRAEISLLNDHAARSLPTPASGVTLSKVRQVHAALPVNEAARREVGLESLIAEGAGKRPKKGTSKRDCQAVIADIQKATVATTLGFDFIPDSTITPLPDNVPALAPRPATSLLTQSKTSSLILPAQTKQYSHPLSSLSNTPETPGLLPHTSSGDDLDEWEHVEMLSEAEHSPSRDDEDSLSEDDVIVLGEMELDDEFDRVQAKRSKRHAEHVVKVTSKIHSGVTYAAAVGIAKV